MGIFKRFAGAFLLFFGAFILYFNLVMALNVVGGNEHITPFLGLFVIDNTRWTSDYYFGFDSIWGILDNLPSAFNMDNFLQLFDEFVKTLNPFGEFLSSFKYEASYGNAVVQLLQTITTLFTGLFSILTAPFNMLYHFILLNIALFDTIIQALNFILTILNGTYNVEVAYWDSPLVNYFQNTPLPHTSNGVSVPQVASVVVSGGVVTVQ